MKITRVIKVGDTIAKLVLTEDDLLLIAEQLQNNLCQCELGHPIMGRLESPEAYANRCGTFNQERVVGYIENIYYDRSEKSLTVIIAIVDHLQGQIQAMQDALAETGNELVPKLRLFTSGGYGTDYKLRLAKVITFDLCPSNSHGETHSLCSGYVPSWW